MSFGGPNQPWQRNVMPFQNVVPQQNVYNMPAFANNAVQMNPYGGGGGTTVPQVAYPQTYNSIGTVTKINNECGLVNDEVFFYRHVCKGQVPKLGDRVLFEAASSTTGQFKWNAHRIQLMPPQPLMSNPISSSSISDHKSGNSRFGSEFRDRNSPMHDRRSSPAPRDRRDERTFREREQLREKERGREREREREREQRERVRERNIVQRSSEREDFERNRKRRREEVDRSRERDRIDHEREQAPSKELSRVDQRYLFRIPKHSLLLKTWNYFVLRQRYPSLKIPPNFFEANVKWHESFTLEKPFSLHRSCQFDIMHDTVEPLVPHGVKPNDEDSTFSAKVMLLSCPPLSEIYRKCFENDKERLFLQLRFLVATRGNEPMLIGGAWSPSLDGPNPDKDPAVLIRTAIRKCQALTGIDLSNCTQWCRICELHYVSSNNTVNTVVIFLPDIHSCMPSVEEWQKLRSDYKAAAEEIIARNEKQTNNNTKRLTSGDGATAAAKTNETQTTKKSAVTTEKKRDANKSTAGNDADETIGAANKTAEEEEQQQQQEDERTTDALNTSIDSSTGEGASAASETQNTVGDNIDDNEKEKLKPTHHSKLDLKTMKVIEIRNELAARNLPSKGARTVLMARLAKAINTEKAEELKQKEDEAKNKKETEIKIKEENSDADDDGDIEMAENPEDESTDDATNGQTNEETEKETTNEENNESLKDNEEQDEWNEGGVDVDMNDIVILDEYDSSKNPEDAPPKKFTAKEKKQIRDRYNLPKSPHIIVHPNRTAKNGEFDCFVAPLKQFSNCCAFEVFIFAECFKEMLARDFAFNIYKELYIYAESRAKESKELNGKNESKDKDDNKTTHTNNNKKDEDKNKTNNEKNEEKAANNTADIKSDDGQSSKALVKRREHHDQKKKNMITVKPHLLLSFIYFEIYHYGYVFMKDLSELFLTTGINLSRGQVEKLWDSVTTRTKFEYRTLTDKESTPDSIPSIEDISNIDNEVIHKIALLNFALAKKFDDISDSKNESDREMEDGLVNFNGTVVHVGKLMEQIQRTEKSFSDLEKLYNDLRHQNADLQKEHLRANNKIKDLSSDVKSLNRKLADTHHDLNSTNRKCREQLAAINSIYRRLEPFIEREKEKKDEKEKKHEKKDEKDKDHKTETVPHDDKEKKNKDKVKEKEKEKVSQKARENVTKSPKKADNARKSNDDCKKTVKCENNEQSKEMSTEILSEKNAESDAENADCSNNDDDTNDNNDEEMNEEN